MDRSLLAHWERLAADLCAHLEWLKRGELDHMADDVDVLRRRIAAFDTAMRKASADA